MTATVIALSGGIASGKSAVSDRLQALGATILDADIVSREVVAPGTAGLAAICERFGSGVLATDGSLDRRALRERVFRNPEERRALESIVHPAVRDALRRGAAAVSQGIVILAIPLLVESGHYGWVDRVVIVDTRRRTQIERLMRRDGIDLALATQMIDAQTARSKRLAIADDVIANDGNLELLTAHVDAVWERWRTAFTRTC